MSQRPQGYTVSDKIMAEIADLLIAQNELLGQVLDRLPEQPTPPEEASPGGTVELREPRPASEPSVKSAPVRKRTTSKRQR